MQNANQERKNAPQTPAANAIPARRDSAVERNPERSDADLVSADATFFRIEVAGQTSWIRRAAVSAVWRDRWGMLRFLDQSGQELARFNDAEVVQALVAELAADPAWANGQRADDDPDRVFLSLSGCVAVHESIYQLGDVLAFRASGRQFGIVVDDVERTRVQLVLDAAS